MGGEVPEHDGMAKLPGESTKRPIPPKKKGTPR